MERSTASVERFIVLLETSTDAEPSGASVERSIEAVERSTDSLDALTDDCNLQYKRHRLSDPVGSGFRNAFQSSLAMHCKMFLDETPSGDNVFVTSGSQVFGFLDFGISDFLDFWIFGF